jgi:hypothetical protein
LALRPGTSGIEITCTSRHAVDSPGPEPDITQASQGHLEAFIYGIFQSFFIEDIFNEPLSPFVIILDAGRVCQFPGPGHWPGALAGMSFRS